MRHSLSAANIVEHYTVTIPSSLAQAIQKTQEWLKELCDKGDLADTNESISVLRVVLHVLRDCLTMEEAVDLGAQLPTVVRGIYYDGWRPHKVTVRLNTKQNFIDAMLTRGFPNAVPVERAVRDVFALLAHHCDPGEISNVVVQLPAALKELWPKQFHTT
jgi:uncharacterized protein (DUF2267 family)